MFNTSFTTKTKILTTHLGQARAVFDSEVLNTTIIMVKKTAITVQVDEVSSTHVLFMMT